MLRRAGAGAVLTAPPGIREGTQRPADDDITLPQRAMAVRRAAARLCVLMGWAPVHEVTLPNGRRADILALLPDRDFLTDQKWPEYRDFCDALYFAVDGGFPQELLPAEVGLIVASDREAELVREAPAHKLPPSRRRALLLRFAALAATRLAVLEDPGAAAALRGALRAE